MLISIIQIFEKNFASNLKVIEDNAFFCQKNNLKYILLDNTDDDEILKNIRNIQKKSKLEYMKKKFENRTENILKVLDLVETEKVIFIYEFDLLPENFAKQNFPANNNSNNSPIQIFQKLNLNINPKNKTNKFYNNNYVFIFETKTLKEILEKINQNKDYLKNWNVEIFYFYIKSILKQTTPSNLSDLPPLLSEGELRTENKYLINCLDYESYNNKEIFLAKKYRKEYLKLKYKFSKNILEKLKIKFGLV
jgi:hypothetical protein